MSLAKQRSYYRERAISHGWTMINAGSSIDVFRLPTPGDEYRYLYLGYRDIGLDLDHTFLALPHESRIIGVTDPALAPGIVTEWIEDLTDVTEEEYQED